MSVRHGIYGDPKSSLRFFLIKQKVTVSLANNLRNSKANNLSFQMPQTRYQLLCNFLCNIKICDGVCYRKLLYGDIGDRHCHNF